MVYSMTYNLPLSNCMFHEQYKGVNDHITTSTILLNVSDKNIELKVARGNYLKYTDVGFPLVGFSAGIIGVKEKGVLHFSYCVWINNVCSITPFLNEIHLRITIYLEWVRAVPALFLTITFLTLPAVYLHIRTLYCKFV